MDEHVRDALERLDKEIQNQRDRIHKLANEMNNLVALTVRMEKIEKDLDSMRVSHYEMFQAVSEATHVAKNVEKLEGKTDAIWRAIEGIRIEFASAKTKLALIITLVTVGSTVFMNTIMKYLVK